jgi:dihydropteroate synthase
MKHLITDFSTMNNKPPPQIMGIVNVTPDSFSDGGLYHYQEAAFDHAMRLIDEGADIVDIGGESTRPGAMSVSVDEELERVVPLVERLRGETDTTISVDTSKAAVMEEVLAVGADMINDVTALASADAVTVVAKHAVPVCIMHMQGEPRTMQHHPHYADVVSEVEDYLIQRAHTLHQQGISDIIIDPGFGFGKTLEHNIALVHQLSRFTQSDYPVLVGMSRKSMLGALTGQENSAKRLGSSIAAALVAWQQGAAIIRVHDVRDTVDAIKVWHAVHEEQYGK